MIGHWAISDLVIFVKHKCKPFNISVIQVYALKTDADHDAIDSLFLWKSRYGYGTMQITGCHSGYG